MIEYIIISPLSLLFLSIIPPPPFLSLCTHTHTHTHTHTGKPTLKLVSQSLCCVLLSWVASTITIIAIAFLLQGLGRALSWYAHPELILPLYAVPSFLTMAALHSYWMYRVSVGN